jgi:exodeoxyribonuclease VII small subunit
MSDARSATTDRPAHAHAASPDGPTIEASLQELEDIVDLLESDPPDLESAIDAYEKGVALARSCLQRLNEAEQRVTELALDDRERA